MLKLKKRGPNTINQGRLGLGWKNQDLIARILLGGRTGMQNYENSRALKAKRLGRAMDL
jgi:hypothetical protein